MQLLGSVWRSASSPGPGRPISLGLSLVWAILAVPAASRLLGRQRLGELRTGPPIYEGPGQGLVNREAWNWDDHGVSWNIGQCRSGIDQSPVKFNDSAVVQDDHNLYHRYHIVETPVSVYNDGFLLSITMNSCVGGFGVMVPEDKEFEFGPLEMDEKYSLALITFHAPSEHLWNDEHLALEMQLVHRRTDDPSQLGILSVGFQQDETADTHSFLSALTEEPFPRQPMSEVRTNTRNPHRLDLSALIGENKTFRVYHGSMTIPKCKTNARWFVRKEREHAPVEQLDKFVDAIRFMTNGNGNNRVVQNLNSRIVKAMYSRDATLHQTVRQKFGAKPPPTVRVQDPGPDKEDAVEPAPAALTDDVVAKDEGVQKKKNTEETWVATDPDSVMRAFSESDILEDPDKIIAQDHQVKEVQAVQDEVQEEANEAGLQEGQACKDVLKAQKEAEQGDDSSASTLNVLFLAKKKQCEAALAVSDAANAELKVATEKADEVKSEAMGGAMAAQDRTNTENKDQFNQTKTKDETRPAPMERSPEGGTVVWIKTPQGAVNDPFAEDCSEDVSRINDESPLLSEHLVPSLDKPADVQGIHTIHEDEGEASATTGDFIQYGLI